MTTISGSPHVRPDNQSQTGAVKGNVSTSLRESKRHRIGNTDKICGLKNVTLIISVRYFIPILTVGTFIVSTALAPENLENLH